MIQSQQDITSKPYWNITRTMIAFKLAERVLTSTASGFGISNVAAFASPDADNLAVASMQRGRIT